MRGRMKVRGNSHDEHNQDQKGGNGVQDENRRQSFAHSLGHVEGIIVIGKGIAYTESVSPWYTYISSIPEP